MLKTARNQNIGLASSKSKFIDKKKKNAQSARKSRLKKKLENDMREQECFSIEEKNGKLIEKISTMYAAKYEMINIIKLKKPNIEVEMDEKTKAIFSDIIAPNREQSQEMTRCSTVVQSSHEQYHEDEEDESEEDDDYNEEMSECGTEEEEAEKEVSMNVQVPTFLNETKYSVEATPSSNDDVNLLFPESVNVNSIFFGYESEPCPF